MNRYLIAALYVMAGCAVTVPLKAQGNGEPFRGERCRLMITNTVKVISVYLEDESEEHEHYLLPADRYAGQVAAAGFHRYFFTKTVRVSVGPLCRSSHKIRAPENL